MKCDGLYVAGAATWLPPVMDAADALAAGVTDEDLVTATGQVAVTVSECESGPEMAAYAGKLALARSGLEPADVSLLLHASVFYPGHDMWAPASFVQREVGTDGLAMEVRQASNGGLASMELAMPYLRADPSRRAALLTTGDRFCPPRFDRWRSDRGTVYADGGTAVVLSAQHGFARLRSLVSVSASELEGLARGDDPFGDEPFQYRPTVDLEVNKRGFLKQVGVSYAITRLSAGQRRVIEQALADAGAELADIARFSLPHLGERRLKSAYLSPLGIDVDRCTWGWSRGVGHLGAGDPFAGLEHLIRSGGVRAGELCLLTSVGAGFTWSCAVFEILDVPLWADGRDQAAA